MNSADHSLLADAIKLDCDGALAPKARLAVGGIFRNRPGHSRSETLPMSRSEVRRKAIPAVLQWLACNRDRANQEI